MTPNFMWNGRAFSGVSSVGATLARRSQRRWAAEETTRLHPRKLLLFLLA